MKVCKSCKQKKEYENFYKNKKSGDGYDYYCKECKYQKKKEWRKNNPKKQSECNKRYKLKHKDRLLEYNKTYYKTERGAESKRLNNSKRRALLKTISDGTITYYATKKLLKEQEYKCNICLINIENRIKRDLDHIHPISKGGLHTIKNVQWLCKKCNNKKSNKLNYKLK